ncbi:MAG TPA: hypothetical protein VEV45_20695 [Streptosporangiaceae bacterium]|nr:hypothetical protein [Streptosporangiaceae bacterium]
MTHPALHNYAPQEHTDGSPMFMVPADRYRSLIAAGQLQAAWRMQLIPMPSLSFVGYLASRAERPCCWVSIISRSYSYPQLMSMGGVILKYRTWNTMRRLAVTPLSLDWIGAVVVWDLPDGLYCQNVLNMPDYRAQAFDPRGAPNDIEPAVLVHDLVRVW